MKRLSPKSINVKSNLKVNKVYPLLDTKKTIDTLKTVGVQLNKQQAIEVARVLLAVTQNWSNIDLTFYRKPDQKGKYNLTITSRVSE